MRFLLYARDTTVFKHEVRWNWFADLPFGRGKAFARNANRWIDGVIGGWEISGLGRCRSNYFTLPGDGSGLWPTGNAIEYYGQQYPIEDCRSGVCRPGYLMWNGYIPAHQINSTDPRTGRPNGIWACLQITKPAVAPLHPFPADYASRNAANYPMYNYYGTSTEFRPAQQWANSGSRLCADSSVPQPVHPEYE
jgi:hypothetical protein